MHARKNNMLRNAHAEDSSPLCWATTQRFPCSLAFRALTIYIPRLSCLKNYTRCLQHARSRPRQQVQPQTSTNTRHVFSARIWPFSNLLRRPFLRLFPFLLQFDLWKTFFADLSTRQFPFLLEFDLYTAYFVNRLARSFFSGDYNIALSDDFDIVWETSVKTFMLSLTVHFCQFPTVLFRYSVLGAYCFFVSL